MKAEDFCIGTSWAWCYECGAKACAEGKAAPPLEHVEGCASVRRAKERAHMVVTAVDAEKGTITIETVPDAKERP